MATGKTYGNKIRPSGQVDGFTSSESELAKFLYPLAWRSTVFVNDDFTGAVLDTSKWIIAKIASNGTNFIPTSTQLANGTITGITGNGAAADHVNIRNSAVWLGDLNCGVEFRFKIDNADDIEWQFGFSDPWTSYTSTPTLLGDIDTPTLANGVTDVAFIGHDTAQTAEMAFVTDGSTASMDPTKTDLGTRVPTNATYMTCRVQLAKTASAVAASSAYVLDANGGLVEQASHGGTIASQIKGDVLLHPFYYLQTLTTASKTVDIDYISIWQDRITS